MRSTPSPLLAKIAAQVSTLATCWRIQRKDSTELFFTDHDSDIVYDGDTYQAATGFTRTAYEQHTGLVVDNMDIQGFFDSAAITESDVLAGKYKDAKIWAFILDYTDVSLGIHKLDYGYLGEVTIRDNIFVCEFRSLAQRLQQVVGDKYGRMCRVRLGSTECGINLTPDNWAASTVYAVGDEVSPTTYNGFRYVCTTAGTSNDTEGEPTWDTTIGQTTTETDGVGWETAHAWTKQGTVTGVTSRKQFADTSRTESDNFFRYGILTWVSTTNGNDGRESDVKRSVLSGNHVYLRFNAPYDIAVGDTYTITTGCNHLMKMPSDVVGSAYTGDCVAKFSNAPNFRGECEIPGDDDIFAGYQGG